MTDTFPVDWGPLDVIGLKSNGTEAGCMPPLMVLCRSPADDGWLAIEAKTAVIYTLYDTIAYLYRRYSNGKQRNQESDFATRCKQAALLARAEWFCHPSPPPEPRKRIGVKR